MALNLCFPIKSLNCPNFNTKPFEWMPGHCYGVRMRLWYECDWVDGNKQKKKFNLKRIRKLLINTFIWSFFVVSPKEYYMSFCVRLSKKMRTIQYNMWLIARIIFTRIYILSLFFVFWLLFWQFFSLSYKCLSIYDGKLVMNIFHYVMLSHPKLIWNCTWLLRNINDFSSHHVFLYINSSLSLSDSIKLILI